MATPARNTRSRAASVQPLPATAVHTSNAYGSRGVADLSSQLDTAGTSLADGFRARRRGAGTPVSRRDRDSSAEVSATESPQKIPPKRKSRVTQPIIEEEGGLSDGTHSQTSLREPRAPQPREIRPNSGHGTGIEVTAPYEARSFNAARNRRPSPQQQSRPDASGEVDQSWSSSVLFNSVLPFFNRLFTGLKSLLLGSPLLVVLIVLSTAATIFFNVPHLPSGIEAHRARMIRGARLIAGLPEWEQPPSGLEKEWIWFKHYRQFHPEELPDYNVPDLQWTININLVGRIEKLEEKTKELASAIDSVNRTILEALPRMLAVDVVDKRVQIPDNFYAALHEKLLGDESLWSAFLDSNKQAIDEIENDRLRTFYDDAVQSRHIISASTAFEMIKSDNARLLETFSKNNEEERNAFVKDIRQIAESVVGDVLAADGRLAASSGSGVDALAKEFYIQNTLDEMRNINFFSPKNGAVIDPRLTSPSAVRPQKTWMARQYQRWFITHTSPLCALIPWFDYADAWCASESDSKGKAQFGVITKHVVAPTELIVEHIPASGTLTIATAPRDVELWMDLGSSSAARFASDTIKQESIRLKAQGQCGEAPGETFACIGKGRYDIHSSNWVQKFPVFMDLMQWQLASNHFVFKVMDNWGADQTCIYRVRLHGQPTSA